MRLNLHRWGDPDGTPLVCLHGLSGHGARFRRLGERLPGRLLVAPDLRGHGRSGWAPPWSIRTHLDDLLETVAALELRPADWLGFSFGGRLAAEVAASDRGLVERLCLLDPALSVGAELASGCVDDELAGASFASPEEAVEASLTSGFLKRTPRELVEAEVAEHLVRRADGSFAYRYSRGATVVAFSELVSEPPPVADVPTLLVTGDDSWIPVDKSRYPSAQIVSVPGGHSVLMDALDESAAAIAGFLAP